MVIELAAKCELSIFIHNFFTGYGHLFTRFFCVNFTLFHHFYIIFNAENSIIWNKRNSKSL